MRLILRAVLLIALLPRIALAQPSETRPPDYDRLNWDATGGITNNDSAIFQDKLFTVGHPYDAARPFNVGNVAASVSAQTVTVTWVNPTIGPAPTSRWVVWGGGVLQVPAPAQSAQINPGSGVWTISVVSRGSATINGTSWVTGPYEAAPSASVTVSGGPTPSVGWTDLTPIAGASLTYVSSAGSDSNTGSQTSPLKTIAAGYSRMRTGSGDTLYLRAGDTFDTATLTLTKNKTTITGYGIGARPVIRGMNATVILAKGLTDTRIVGLTITPNITTFEARKYGVQINECRNTLIEDCYIHGATYGVVIESPNQANRNVGVSLRRNLWENNGGVTSPDYRGGAVYMSSADQWLIEENTGIHNGWPRQGAGNSNTGRGYYVQKDGNSGDCTPGVFVGNTEIDDFDGAGQVRCGGKVHNNLSISCPMGLMVFDVADAQYNVFLESGDVNPTDARGWGLTIGAPNSIVKNNVLAYNDGTGWGSVYGLKLSSGGGVVEGNWLYEWTRKPNDGGQGDTREGISIICEGGSWTMNGNRVYMANPGIAMQVNAGATSNGSGNAYFCPTGGLGDFRPQNVWPGWGKVSLPNDPNLRALLPGGSIDAYAALCRGQSKATWREDLTAAAVNKLIRERVGVSQPVNP